MQPPKLKLSPRHWYIELFNAIDFPTVKLLDEDDKEFVVQETGRRNGQLLRVGIVGATLSLDKRRAAQLVLYLQRWIDSGTIVRNNIDQERDEW